jgi:chromosome segregation ATPase
MDATTQTCQKEKQPAYTTSKQVQAWFLGRSRNRWKEKCAKLRAQAKRLRQRVADACKSRTAWRTEAEASRREAQELRTQNAVLQAQLDALADSAQKKRSRLARLD